MAEKTFMLGIVGLGGMGNWHRELIQSIDNLEVAGIWDIDPKRQQFARDNGTKIYDGLNAMLNDDTIDIILVATPNDVHMEIVCKALNAGKNVVCEKPAALSSAQLETMLKTAKEKGKLLTVHQNRRWDEDFLTIKQVYDEKALGEVFRIESRVHGSRGIPGDWRHEKEKGGGMILDWGVHIIDQMLLMVDEKIKSVYCHCDHVTNELVDDGFSLTLNFESGKVGYLEVGTSNFISLPRWYMLGVNGTAVIEDFNMNGRMVCALSRDEEDVVPVRTAAGLTKTMAPRRDDTTVQSELVLAKADIRDFYSNVMAAISGKEEAIVTPNQVMRVMKLMEAAFLSDSLGRAVDFE